MEGMWLHLALPPMMFYPMATQIGISRRYERCYHYHTGWRRVLNFKKP